MNFPPPSAPAPVTLATIGGTAVESAPLPPVPGSVWGIVAAAALILAYAGRRSRVNSAPACRARPSTFRALPMEA